MRKYVAYIGQIQENTTIQIIMYQLLGLFIQNWNCERCTSNECPLMYVHMGLRIEENQTAMKLREKFRRKIPFPMMHKIFRY